MCFCECFQCNAKLLLYLATTSAKTRERALCNLFKFGAPLWVLTPEILIDAECRNEKHTRVVVAVSERWRRSLSNASGTTNCNPTLCRSKKARSSELNS
jgi:hypothetical protein